MSLLLPEKATPEQREFKMPPGGDLSVAGQEEADLPETPLEHHLLVALQRNEEEAEVEVAEEAVAEGLRRRCPVQLQCQ